MSFDDQDRDLFGNVRTSTHDQFEGHRAGTTEYDTAETSYNKVLQQRERDRLFHANEPQATRPYVPGSGVDTNGYGTKFLLIFLAGSLVIGGVISVVDGFSTGRSRGMKEIAEQRFERHADFSTPAQWPERLQATIKQSEQASLELIYRSLPSDPARLSQDQQAKLGAKIWFSIASKGSAALRYADSAKWTAMRGRKWFDEKPLVLSFLRKQCALGVAAGCLDAARVQAGNIFDLPDYIDEEDSDKKALAELPTHGSLANSADIAALRDKLSEGVNHYDLAHIKFKIFQIGR